MSPVGYLFVARTPSGICALYLLDSEDPTPGLDRLVRAFPGVKVVDDPSLANDVRQVVAHVTEGAACDDMPLDLYGTPFQRKVWQALRQIPRGETITYSGLAVKMGLPPGAARAVGTACGTNQVSLIVPCHRVVSAGGGLGGYYWGLERKQALIDLEQS